MIMAHKSQENSVGVKIELNKKYNDNSVTSKFQLS